MRKILAKIGKIVKRKSGTPTRAKWNGARWDALWRSVSAAIDARSIDEQIETLMDFEILVSAARDSNEGLEKFTL